MREVGKLIGWVDAKAKGQLLLMPASAIQKLGGRCGLRRVKAVNR
jgi:hypothetical protein